MPYNAIFTKTPLKKIEKDVFTSTWVFVNQKWKGQIGIFIPKPKNNNNFMAIISTLLKIIKSTLKKLGFITLGIIIKKAKNIKKEPNCVHNKK